MLNERPTGKPHDSPEDTTDAKNLLSLVLEIRNRSAPSFPRCAKKLCPFLLTIVAVTATFAQHSFDSEYFIKYNTFTHKPSKPIPFDHAFTLALKSPLAFNIRNAEVYEVSIDAGERHLKNSICDFPLNFYQSNDSVYLYFPAVKPNVLFDINVGGTLTDACREKLLSVNANLFNAADTAQAHKDYKSFTACTLEPTFKARNGLQSFSAYMTLFSYASLYNDLTTATNFKTGASLTLEQIQGIDTPSKNYRIFAEGPGLIEAVKKSQFANVELGLVTLSPVPIQSTPYKKTMPSQRLAALDTTITQLKAVLRRVDMIISNGYSTVTIGGVTVDFDAVRTQVGNMLRNCMDNSSFIQSKLSAINLWISQHYPPGHSRR